MDVDFAFTNTSTQPQTGNDWRSVLVGGLGAGGRSVYALDVTNPIAPPPPFVSTDTEATAASKVLWEFTDANLGYVYDAPTLVKTYAYGWVVLVASGFNNVGGKGFLYVLNPNAPTKAGQLLKKIPLPGDTGSDTDPTDLSTVRAFTGSRQNPYALQAYGGDMKGNVWRFDLSNPDATKWKAERIATLKDGTGKLSAPEPNTQEFSELRLLGETLRPILERHFLTLALLEHGGSGYRTRRALENDCHLLAQRLALLYEFNTPEHAEKTTFSALITQLVDAGLLREDTAGLLYFDQRITTPMAHAELVLPAEARQAIRRMACSELTKPAN